MNLVPGRRSIDDPRALQPRAPGRLDWLRPTIMLLVVLIPLGAGALIATNLKLALAVAVGIVMAVLVTINRNASAYSVALVGIIAVAATVDLTAQLRVGTTTAYAWITGAIALIVLGLWLFGSRPLDGHGSGYGLLFLAMLFPIFSVFSILWSRPTMAGVQNILVYFIFAGVLGIAMMAARSGEFDFTRLRTALFWTYTTAATLYVGSLILGGLGGGTVVGARSFALLALTGVAWGFALGINGFKREALLGGVCLLLILLSLSRLAFVAGLLILCLAALDFRSPNLINRSIVILSVVALSGYGALAWFGPFRDRFLEGDVVSIGGSFTLNVEGRADLWSIVWRSTKDAPLFGQGAGSAESKIAEALGQAGHPHNDFLRIFHDFGLLGLSLFAITLVLLFWRSWRRLAATTDRQGRALHLAALLELVAFCAAMATDNAVVYVFVVVPIAVIVGASLGSVVPARGADHDPPRGRVFERVS